MRILDSRRLTGASLWLDRPGAILDVSLEGLDAGRALGAWMEHVMRLRDAVGWEPAPIDVRVHAAGASLALEAPFDQLYSATELNEAAWYAAVAQAGGDPEQVGGENVPEDAPYAPPSGGVDPEKVVAWLREHIAAERKPALVSLAVAAAERGATLLADDDVVSTGLGEGCRAWPAAEVPIDPAAVPWGDVHDVPVALVTGTNGKSTTVRLLGAIARAAGVTAGITSTDRVTVGEETVAEGDFSGPSGARTVLRDARVEMAFLELARGGILRRGLAAPRVRVALVTNVDNDHLGEFGIFDVPSLADVKMVVAKAVVPDGRMVLNADDPLLLERGQSLDVPVLWFTLESEHPQVRAHIAAGGDAAMLEGDSLVLVRAGARQTIAAVRAIPITMDGAARHNIANALAAIGVASALGLPVEVIAEGLKGFANTPGENPGRANVWDLGGMRAIVDYAHNPSGVRALAAMTAAMPAKRRALVIGQAGDRSDDAIRELVQAAWGMRPDRVFIKEMESFLRGREFGVVPELIERAFRELGLRSDQIEHHPTEFDAVTAAIAWAREGDLLLLTTHAEREKVIGLLERLRSTEWRPGRVHPVEHETKLRRR